MEALLPEDPRTIGGHQIVARLGAGGMGQVYLGIGPDGRQAAVKVIRADLGGPESLARFRREVATVGAVRSPHTAALIDAGLDLAPYWLATEYVPGITLTDAVQQFGALPPDLCRKLAADLAQALSDVHRQGVQHRDLKPQNIILAETGPRLIDFGIARGEDQTAITRTGGMAGTPGYLAPEVITRQERSPAADVFALAGVIAYAATGRPPFGGGELHAVLYRSVNGELDLDGVDPLIAAVAGACAAKDPAARPPLSWVIEQCGGPEQLSADPVYRERILSAAAVAPQDVATAMRIGLLPATDPTTDRSALRRGPRAGVALGATAGVVAVLLLTVFLLHDSGTPSGNKPSGPVQTSGTTPPSSTVTPGTVPTEVLRDRTGLTTSSLFWNSARDDCTNQVRYEETPPSDLQWEAGLKAAKSKGTIAFGLRIKYGAKPGYYIAADVSPPGDLNGSDGVHFTSKPKLMHASDWTGFNFPQDFGGNPFFEKGDWTIIWYHVHPDGEAYFINCNGFQIT